MCRNELVWNGSRAAFGCSYEGLSQRLLSIPAFGLKWEEPRNNPARNLSREGLGRYAQSCNGPRWCTQPTTASRCRILTTETHCTEQRRTLHRDWCNVDFYANPLEKPSLFRATIKPAQQVRLQGAFCNSHEFRLTLEHFSWWIFSGCAVCPMGPVEKDF